MLAHMSKPQRDKMVHYVQSVSLSVSLYHVITKYQTIMMQTGVHAHLSPIVEPRDELAGWHGTHGTSMEVGYCAVQGRTELVLYIHNRAHDHDDTMPAIDIGIDSRALNQTTHGMGINTHEAELDEMNPTVLAEPLLDTRTRTRSLFASSASSIPVLHNTLHVLESHGNNMYSVSSVMYRCLDKPIDFVPCTMIQCRNVFLA
jgi:hypothetical protein